MVLCSRQGVASASGVASQLRPRTSVRNAPLHPSLLRSQSRWPRPCQQADVSSTGRPQAAGSPGRPIVACSAAVAATTAAAGAAAAAAPNGLFAQATSGVAGVLLSLGIFIFCCAAAAFLVACIPSVWAMAQAAHRMAALLATANKEMPETMATLRLSGLEVTDCINQITGLGSDLTGGIRSTAKLATMAEQGVKTGAAVVDQTVTKHVMPVLAKSERTAREVLEAQLRERAKLTYSVAAVREAAQGTSTLVRRVRLGLWAAGAANTAVRAGVAMREVFDASAARQMQAAADVAQQQQAAVRRSSAAARAATTAARAAAQQAASSSVSTAALPNAE